MQQSSIDQLFRIARETEPYIDDQDFAEQVGAEIRRRQLLAMAKPSKQPILILLLATLLGASIFYSISPVELWVTELLVLLSSSLTLVMLGVAGLAFSFVAALLIATDHI